MHRCEMMGQDEGVNFKGVKDFDGAEGLEFSEE